MVPRDKPHFGLIVLHRPSLIRTQHLTMAIQSIVWMGALLFLAQVSSMPTCQLEQHLLDATFHLLQAMGGRFPAQCLQDNVAISFPTSAFTTGASQMESARAIYETLKGIDSLFEADDLPSEWDEKKLDNFQNIVYRQTEESSCLMRGGADWDSSARSAVLRTYFGTLTRVLKDKNSSYCAWEVVRKELLNTLLFILTNNSDGFRGPNRT